MRFERLPGGASSERHDGIRHLRSSAVAGCPRLPLGGLGGGGPAVAGLLPQAKAAGKALALSPARQPGGSVFSFLTLPPPRTT